MQHWYVYHSIETMGHPYESGVSAVYTTSEQRKLCFGDIIWVIEGDIGKHKQFRLVDCFRNNEQKYPPFPIGYTKFRLKVSGEVSLLKGPIPLSKEYEWFSELHSKFITKQKFFNVLTLQISDGLLNTSGITL